MTSPLRRIAFLAAGISVGALLYFWNSNRAAPSAAPELEAPRLATRAKGAPPSEKKWRAATEKERQTVTKTIRAQLDAFKRDDWEAAASHQSAGLKANFASTKDFRRVIEENYPQFANYKSVNFDNVHVGGEWAMVDVTLTGQDGVKINATYQMVREDGAFKVAGVGGGARPNSSVEQQPPRDLV